MDNHQLSMPDWGDRNWSILPKELMEIKQRIEKAGTPLNHPKWDLTINRGILTGYNDAFIIDTETKEALIAEDPKSAEILYPILRGKDIEAYYPNFQGLWLIFVPWHFPFDTGLKPKARLPECYEDNENALAKEYPGIYQHLLKHKDKLSARNKAEVNIRYEWYALQRWAANYWEDFEKPKIIYPNLTKYLPFVFDKDDTYFTNQKCYILTGPHLEYLTILFNSTLWKFTFRDIFPPQGEDRRELGKVFFQKQRLKQPNPSTEPIFVWLCQTIIAYKKNTSALDNEDLEVTLTFLDSLANALIWEHYFWPDGLEKTSTLAEQITQDLNEGHDTRDGNELNLEVVKSLLRQKKSSWSHFISNYQKTEIVQFISNNM